MPHSAYFDALVEANGQLAHRFNALFVGQAVEYPGTAMHDTLACVPKENRVELPVFEDTQLGLSIGLALQSDRLVVSLFPRWSFLLCATNQLVSHLAQPVFGGLRPKVIIRVGAPTAAHLDPGPQHLGDHTQAFVTMLDRGIVTVLDLNGPSPREIVYAYRWAAEAPPALIVEHTHLYFEDA